MANTTTKYAVVYWVTGERHRMIEDYETLDAAQDVLASLRQEGFSAQIEHA